MRDGDRRGRGLVVVLGEVDAPEVAAVGQVPEAELEVRGVARVARLYPRTNTNTDTSVTRIVQEGEGGGTDRVGELEGEGRADGGLGGGDLDRVVAAVAAVEVARRGLGVVARRARGDEAGGGEDGGEGETHLVSVCERCGTETKTLRKREAKANRNGECRRAHSGIYTQYWYVRRKFYDSVLVVRRSLADALRSGPEASGGPRAGS